MKNLILILLGCIVLASCQTSCTNVKATNTEGVAVEKKTENCVSDTLMTMIKIDSVRMEKVADELKLTGEVTFDQNKVLRVMPAVSGQVSAVNVQLGDYVKAGQTLLVMHSVEVAGNFHERSTADADLATAQKNRDNAESLWKAGLGTERDYIQSKNEVNKAESAVNKINSVMKVYGSNQASNGEITIKAPSSGYIVEKKVNAGQFVRPDNADNLFTISNLSDIWVMANVYETDISRVREGYNVTVKTIAYPDKIFTGRIEKMSRVLDPDSKVLKARIRLDNGAGLLNPQMFTEVTVKNTEGVSALAIPAKAVLMDNGKNFVVTYVDRCHYDIRAVELIKTVGERAYIKSGLQAGEKVVSNNEVLLFQQIKGD
jgi:membrane fusion protein, heavy metal efflux system